MPVIEEAPVIVEPERPPSDDEAVFVQMREVVREQQESPALDALRAETSVLIVAFGDEGDGGFTGYGY